MAKNIGNFLFLINGCLTNRPVLNPNFSAFAIASSVVPLLSHSFLNFLNASVFLNSLLSEWSADKAIKLAPNIVSGLVVKIFIFVPVFSISNLISQPNDFPIQFFCINLTFSGQPSSLSRSFKSSFENFVILKNH